MIRLPYSVPLRLVLGALWACTACGFSGFSLGQVESDRVPNPLSAVDGRTLRLSTELSGLRGGVDELPVLQGLVSKPAETMRTDSGREDSLPLKPDFNAEMERSAPSSARRFSLPPGELNTSGVVRAGRMSIQNGVPILQRDGGTRSSPARLAEGESLND